MVDYPDVPNLTEDFEHGFDMVGDVRREPGCRDCDDGRYQNPISLERLGAANLDYVRRRTSSARVAPHSDVMLAELMEETDLDASLGRPERFCGGRYKRNQSPTWQTWIP